MRNRNRGLCRFQTGTVIAALTGVLLCGPGAALTRAQDQAGEDSKDTFDGITLLFDTARGKNGDFVKGPRQITPKKAVRVVILHPKNLKQEYTRSYEKVEYHTAKPPDFLAKWFASSPTERSAVDPMDLNRRSSSDKSDKNAIIKQPPPADPLQKAWIAYQTAFKNLKKVVIQPDPQFAKAAGPLRAELMDAIKNGTSNANTRKLATEAVAAIYNEPTNGLNAPVNGTTQTISFPTPTPVPVKLRGMKRNQWELDYDSKGFKSLKKAATELIVKPKAANDKLRDEFETFLTASNKLALAIQKYRDNQIGSETLTLLLQKDSILGAVVPQLSLSNKTALTDAEQRTLYAYIKTLPAVKTLANKSLVTTQAATEEAAVQETKETIDAALVERQNIADDLQDRLNENNKIARTSVAQKQAYLSGLVAAFTSSKKAYDLLLDIEKLPTYDIATPLDETPGDALEVTVTVTEADAAPVIASPTALAPLDVNLPREAAPASPVSVVINNGAASAAPAPKEPTKAKDKDPLTKKTITLAVYGRTVTDFTVGPYLTGLKDRDFRTTPVAGPGGSGQFVVKEGASDDIGTGLTVMFHRYVTQRGGRPAPAFTIGTQVDRLDTFLVGGSLVFGSRNRIVVSAGAALGKTTVLNGIKVGETIDTASPDTSRVYRPSYFASISFALDLNIK